MLWLKTSSDHDKERGTESVPLRDWIVTAKNTLAAETQAQRKMRFYMRLRPVYGDFLCFLWPPSAIMLQ